MNIKTLLTGLAMTAAIASPAFAQTMVGGVSVSADDLAAVQGRCTELMTKADTPTALSSTSSSDGGTGANNSDNTSEDGTNSDHDATATTAPEPDAMATATTTFDLNTLTVENCTAAGLTTAQ